MFDLNYSLQWAAYNGHLEVCQLLIEKGADVRARNDYALRWAAYHNHLEVCRLLIEKGANIENAIEKTYLRNTKQTLIKLKIERQRREGAKQNAKRH